jgi:response regulator RpfG family c-di-GMP phosphodiesterase
MGGAARIAAAATLTEREASQILVVDDELVIRQILADFLSMEGYQVQTAEDGKAALDKLEATTFDIVISDMKMPRVGGIELIETIRERGVDVLTVIMTAYGTVETAIEAMKKGAYDYLLKPFKMEEVIRVVERGLQNRKLQRENMILKETIALYRASEEISVSLSLSDVLDQLTGTTMRELPADEVILHLTAEGNAVTLCTRVSRDGHKYQPEDLNLGGLLSAHGEGQPILVHGDRCAPFLSDGAPAVTSLLSVPLKVPHRLVGLVTAVSVTPGNRFSEGQRKLLSVLGGRAASAIDNIRLFENLQATFRETIQGFARALEAMDRYTAGHSDRVTRLARMVALELDLPLDEVETVTQAALMHDIGKIGCQANLNKPGKLSAEEYEIFKAHPTFGRQILEPITFLRPIVAGVLSHHERWDGTGYPEGLKGEEIPLAARILAVADTYDAMTSSRAYRKALNHDVTMREIRRCGGSQFDPAVVSAFERAIERYRTECLQRGVAVPE